MKIRVSYRQLAGLVAVLALLGLAACASIGTGRAEVVRAEDVLSNGPILYDVLFTTHRAVSKAEPPEVYEAIERMRKVWPAADRVLRRATRLYKLGTGSKPDFATAFSQADDLLDEIRTLIAATKPLQGGTP